MLVDSFYCFFACILCCHCGDTNTAKNWRGLRSKANEDMKTSLWQCVGDSRLPTALREHGSGSCPCLIFRWAHRSWPLLRDVSTVWNHNLNYVPSNLKTRLVIYLVERPKFKKAHHFKWLSESWVRNVDSESGCTQFLWSPLWPRVNNLCVLLYL